MPEGHQNQGTLRELLHVIFKHQKKIFFIFTAIVLMTALATHLMTPVYEATLKILVKVGRENIYKPATATGNGNLPMVFDSSREERINSEVEILKGRNLIEQVISDIGVMTLYPHIDKKPLLRRNPRKEPVPLEKATLKFTKSLHVEGVRKSDIINIRFQHKNPVIAARVTNKLVDEFLEHHLNVYKQSQGYDFFNAQVTLLKQKLETSEQELEDFKRDNNISSLQDQKGLLLKQISDLDLELARTRSNVSENRGKIEALQGSNLSGVQLGEETELNPFAISAIRSKLSELKLEEQKLLGKFTAESVLVTNIRKEIKKAQELLDREERIYHDKAVTSISHTQSALINREQRQLQHRRTYQDELSRINSLELKLNHLQRQVSLNEETYRLYVRHMEEARLSQVMDSQKIANISIVEPAYPPIKPIKPNMLLNLALAVILGAFVSAGTAFSLEYFSHTFNNREDVMKHLDLPVLASIPEIT